MIKLKYSKKKYSEITGSSCSGKTTKFGDVQGYMTGGNIKECFFPRIVVRSLFLLLGFFYLIVSPARFYWLIGKCQSLDVPFSQKICAIRNVIEKFGCFLLFRNKAVLVDEGISHIPFVFQLSTNQIVTFVMLFEKELQTMDVVFVTPPSKSEIVSRLLARGHSKVTSAKSAEVFASLNHKISEAYQTTLKKHEKLHVTVV